MKRALILAMVPLFSILLASCAQAPQEAQAPAPAEAGSEAVTEVANKMCPVTGKPVGSMEPGAHVDYNGHRVGLCCSGCVSGFMKDADTLLAKAQEDAAAA